MAPATRPLLIAWSDEPAVLGSGPVEIALHFAPYEAGGAAPSAHDTVLLVLEHIVGRGLPPVHDVYVGLAVADPPDPPHRAGALPFYGLEESTIASTTGFAHGLSLALDVTELYEALDLATCRVLEEVLVRLVPRKAMPPGAAASIGRISLTMEAARERPGA